jgi:peptide/nickel transport system substrate-binding protein
MKKPFCASYWGGRPVEDQMFTTAYVSGAEWNDSFWSNESFDELLVAARSELDEAKRRQMYQEMQRDGVDRRLDHHPDVQQLRHGRRDKVATPEKISANWNLDGFRCVERWWFA